MSPPDHLSVSQVTTYLGCPRKYRFRYIDKLESEVKSAGLAFGSAVHTAIEWWQGERIAGREPDPERALRMFRADWSAQLADPLLDLEEKAPEELSAMGEILVRLFIERFNGEKPPIAVEQRFEVDLIDPRTGGQLPVPLVGYLDGVGDGVVWELKTAARKTPVSDYALQLAAYTHAVRQTTGERPVIRVVELIKTKVPKIEVEEVIVSERDEAWFVEVACEVWSAVQAGVFPPVTSGNSDGFCPETLTVASR